MQNLFLFSISPVQSFILQARKTIDLYASSQIISFLCREALQVVREEWGGTIVFPLYHYGTSSLINRFLAVIDENDRDILMEKGRSLENTVQEKFLEMADGVLSELKLVKPIGFDEQIKSFWQLLWLFEPFTGEDYKSAYQNIEMNMSAIKCVRDFSFFTEKPGEKCSLTGEHNALFYRPGEKTDPRTGKPVVRGINKYKRLVIGAVSVDHLSYKYLEAGEQISGLGLVKRGAGVYLSKNNENYITSFPSVTNIAFLDVKIRYKQILQEYLNHPVNQKSEDIVNKLELEYLYDLQNDLPLPDNLPIDEIKHFFRLYNFLKLNKIDLPSYYAIILFDGDSMGNWLRGTMLDKAVNLMDFQKSLSEKLSEFAQEASTEILSANKGRTVYAGGDDFLGLINVNYLFEVMLKLRDRFGEIDLSQFTQEKLTFSAGVVLAHVKTPLHVALSWAREMEKKAKNIDTGKHNPDQNSTKNAFAIAVLKRSGEIHECIYRWYEHAQQPCELLNRVYQYLSLEKPAKTKLKLPINSVLDFNDDEPLQLYEYSASKNHSSFINDVPAGYPMEEDNPTVNRVYFTTSFISKFTSEFMNFDKSKYKDKTIDPILAELKRLIRRSCHIEGYNNLSNDELDELMKEESKKLYSCLENLYYCSKDLRNFISSLNIINFMVRKVKA